MSQKPRGPWRALAVWGLVAALALVVADCAGSSHAAHRVSVQTGPARPGPSTSTSTPATTVRSTTVATSPSTAPSTTARRTTTTSTTAAAPSPTRAPVPATTAPRPPPATDPACRVNAASQLASTGSAQQLITVEAGTAATTVASVSLWQREGRCWEAAGGPWSGHVGYNGFSAHHREGDGTTPIGLYGISSLFYGNDPDPGVHGSYHDLVCGDWWDEDPTSPEYNTFQHVACGQKPPFGGGSEALWTETAAYPSFAVIEYNTGPIVAYAGSAIFLHADLGGGTNGCVSVPLGDLDQILRWLEPGLAPEIAMGPTPEINAY